MINSLSTQYNLQINNLCKLLHERRLQELDVALVALLEIIIVHTKQEENLVEEVMVLEVLLAEFNDYYYKWLKENRCNINNEYKALYSKYEKNLLLAHCNDADSMKDLLYDFINQLTSSTTEDSSEDIEVHIKSYKKVMRNFVSC